MSKIEKISIVHSVSRKYESALQACLKTSSDCNVEVVNILSITLYCAFKNIKHII